MKASHLSEGVGSAGDSHGSQACSLKKDDLKSRARTGWSFEQSLVAEF